MKVYDVMLYCGSTYIGGDFYDTYEYFRMFKDLGYKVCFVSCLDVPFVDVKTALCDKYGCNAIGRDMFFYSLQNSKGKLLPVGAKVLFTTSIYAAADIIVKPIMIYHEKMILIHETVYNDSLIIEAFGDNSKRKLAKILMLGDMRTFDKFGDYEHINYRRKLNFDIWKPLEGFIKHRTMLNMSTEHKCYENGYLQDLMRFYGGDYLIYTRPKYFKSYSLLESNNVDVEMSPIKNFMNQWDTTIYLNSKRGQDPSPRIIAECKFYNKILIWHRPGVYKDGAYYRNIDVLNGLDGLKLKTNDKIFEIVNRYL